jgi:hypothetical protein
MSSGDPISSGSIGMPKSFMVTFWTIQTTTWLSENFRNYQILTARQTEPTSHSGPGLLYLLPCLTLA